MHLTFSPLWRLHSNLLVEEPDVDHVMEMPCQQQNLRWDQISYRLWIVGIDLIERSQVQRIEGWVNHWLSSSSTCQLSCRLQQTSCRHLVVYRCCSYPQQRSAWRFSALDLCWALWASVVAIFYEYDTVSNSSSPSEPSDAGDSESWHDKLGILTGATPTATASVGSTIRATCTARAIRTSWAGQRSVGSTSSTASEEATATSTSTSVCSGSDRWCASTVLPRTARESSYQCSSAIRPAGTTTTWCTTSNTPCSGRRSTTTANSTPATECRIATGNPSYSTGCRIGCSSSASGNHSTPDVGASRLDYICSGTTQSSKRRWWSFKVSKIPCTNTICLDKDVRANWNCPINSSAQRSDR